MVKTMEVDTKPTLSQLVEREDTNNFGSSAHPFASDLVMQRNIASLASVSENGSALVMPKVEPCEVDSPGSGVSNPEDVDFGDYSPGGVSGVSCSSGSSGNALRPPPMLSSDIGTPSSGDAEGVWSSDIEQAFHEALSIYPACGRRKIILSEEGKMYGRNELIARYIKLRTGKTRTRKQVSSHIQVLARKKSRELQAKLKDGQPTKEKAFAAATLASMSSAQLISANPVMSHDMNRGGMYSSQSWKNCGPSSLNSSRTIHPSVPHGGFPNAAAASRVDLHHSLNNHSVETTDNSNARNERIPISSSKIRLTFLEFLDSLNSNQLFSLCEFSAYIDSNQDRGSMESKHLYCRHDFVNVDPQRRHSQTNLEKIAISEIFDKFPESFRSLFNARTLPNSFYLIKFWADICFNFPDEQTAFYAVDSRYQSREKFSLTVSTQVCSFGKVVVEKLETENPVLEDDHFVYRFSRSPMCDYMVNFILKLKQLGDSDESQAKYLQNSVLDNFTILQIVSDAEKKETILCVAFVFQVAEEGPQHRVYQLVQSLSKP